MESPPFRGDSVFYSKEPIKITTQTRILFKIVLTTIIHQRQTKTF